jgi:16S rRNA G966 N2-methylase RsmD
MRVIAGSLKGRRLKSPTWDGLRPTSDQTARDVVQRSVACGRRAGDRRLCGHGAIGIEGAEPRCGARDVRRVSGPRAQTLIGENLRSCGIESGYTMVRSTVERAWSTLVQTRHFAPFDLILLDPPSDQPAGETAGAPTVCSRRWGGSCWNMRDGPSCRPHAGRLDRVRDLRSGDSALAIYTCPH